MCILCILIPILVGLVCALLGYFLGRMIERKSKVYTRLRTDLDDCRKRNERLLSENKSLVGEISNVREKSTSSAPGFDAAMAASAFGKKIVEDDLKLIEGIGPKIAELFHNAGIKSWKALSETSVERCQQILDEAGERFKIHKPASWPEQAGMAYLGKWKALKEWQDNAIGGKIQS